MGDAERSVSPDAERKALLAELGLEESYLASLRDVGIEEARWRIEHEFNALVRFAERRRDWLMSQYGRGPRSQPPRSDQRVLSHTNRLDVRAGTKVG